MSRHDGLSEHVVLLAGATGRIGGAFARHVIDNGGRVAAAVRRPWQVAKLQESLGSERLLVGVVGAQDSEAAAGFVKGANDALGPVTTFVGAAGAWCDAVPGREPQGDLRELLEANLLANATLARAVLPAFRRRARGTLTFVGAPTHAATAASVHYLASKAALLEYANCLARDLQTSGIGVQVFVPDADVASEASLLRMVDALATCALGG